jgi:hypothetical protein
MMTWLNRFLYGAAVLFALAGCGINKQARQLKAFEKCRYEILAADSVFVAGADVQKLIDSRGADLSSLPGVAVGFLSRDIPLTGILQVRITNPSGTLAGVNQFRYKLLVRDKEVVEGISDQRIMVKPGETVTVPLKINANVYRLLTDGSTIQEVLGFMQSAQGAAPVRTTKLGLKIKPTLTLGNQSLNYPGYITVEKEISSNLLQKYLSGINL